MENGLITFFTNSSKLLKFFLKFFKVIYHFLEKRVLVQKLKKNFCRTLLFMSQKRRFPSKKIFLNFFPITKTFTYLNKKSLNKSKGHKHLQTIGKVQTGAENALQVETAKN